MISCKECVKLLSTSDPIEFNDSGCGELIHLRDSGGLTCPSDLLYLTAAVAFHCYQCLRKSVEYQRSLCSTSPNPVDLLISLCLRFIEDNAVLSSVIMCECNDGHQSCHIVKKTLRSCFNIFLKNFIQNLNSETKSKAIERKVKRLSSKKNSSK